MSTSIRYIPTRALALAKALELQVILEAVVDAEDDPGSCPEDALGRLSDIVGLLTPNDNDDPEHEEQS